MIGTIGLGSNLGDRLGHLTRGLAGLERAGLDLVALSSVWETEPVCADERWWFLNMVVRVRTDREPHALLDALLEVERAEGRLRRERNGPRTLDLDLLTLGAIELRTERLEIPHPRMWQRRFVLEPLAEVAPELRNPATGCGPRAEARRLGGGAAVSKLGRLASLRGLPL